MNATRSNRWPNTAAKALAALTLSLGVAHAEPLLTTWRPFDQTWYVTGCHDATAAVQFAKLAADSESSDWVELFRNERCFVLQKPAGAKLLRWLAGPFEGSDPDDSTSLWLIIDEYGDHEYVLFPDFVGSHQSATLT